MLDNFIRGGQIFLHNVAMFKQVVGKTLIISLLISVLITGYLSRDDFSKLDLYAGTTYFKANCAKWIHENRLVLHKDSYQAVPRVDAYDKRGLYLAGASAYNVIKNNKFKSAYQKIEDLVLEALNLTAILTISLIAIVFFIWSKFGKAAKASKLIKGDMVLSAKEVADFLKQNKIASPFVIGDMPLVKDQETRHILVTGMTGVGKTNLFNSLLPQIRQNNQSALIIDQTGEMISRYYDPNRGDIIFNPFDQRSHEWDFWNEVEQMQRLNSIATSIFCTAKSVETVWNNSSKQVFIDSVSVLMKLPERNIAKLYELIATMPLKDVSRKLKGTASGTLLDPAGDKTAMSIRSNTIAFLNWLEHLPETEEGLKFTIKNWVPNTIASNRGSWLFISGLAEERSLLQPLQSLLLDLTILSLQKLVPDHNRRFWLIADELASLKKLHILPQGLAELRKYGGCIMAGLQSLNQIFELYGHYQGSTMFGQFATKFIFRNDEPSMAKLITEMIGSVEYLEHNKNTSYGAHEHRDGISYNEQKRQKLLVSASDLSKLANLECYVHLPNPEVRIAKISTLFVPAPRNIQAGFVPIEQKRVITTDLPDISSNSASFIESGESGELGEETEPQAKVE